LLWLLKFFAKLREEKIITMEIYEEVAAAKRKKIIRRAAIFAGILAVGVSVYFFAFGAGNSFWKRETAIAAQSFKEAFGFSFGENAEEVAIGDASVVSSSVLDAVSGTVSTDTAGNKNIFALSGQSDFQKSSTKNDVVGTGTNGASEIYNGSQTSVSASDTAESASDNTTAVSNSVLGITSSTSLAGNGSSSKKAAFVRCVFPVATAFSPTHKIILNEIAWMGSPVRNGESNTAASNDEWMEIKNETPSAISLAGWEIIDTAKNITIALSDADIIASSSLYLLERTNDDSVPNIPADKIYSGSLPNAGDTIGIFDNHCGLIDVVDATAGWPGGDNDTKRTLERDIGGFGWHTSADLGGTPKAENSNGYVAAVPVSTSSSVGQTSGTSSTQKYMVSVAIAGDGAAKVTSNPAGISCGPYCNASYITGQTVTLHAAPNANVIFSGWSGPCSGTADCVFVVTGYVSATASFRIAEATTMASASSIVDDNDFFENTGASSSSSVSDDETASSSNLDGNSSQTSTYSIASSTDDDLSQASTSVPSVATSTAQSTAISHLVIAAVQIAGASTTNDFVKIYNPESGAVDVSGWKLHKKSSTGTDYSLREMPAGSSVPAGGYFIWANSVNGFSASVGANISSTETLSADNSVALFDATGVVVDEVAWGTGTNQYVEGAAYPTDPMANQTLARIFQNNVIVDTDNNAADFTIQ
jgi:hypothetical protein